MIEFLNSIDRAILLFVNSTLATPVGDWLWPLITDYDKQWPIRIVLVAAWLWLMIRAKLFLGNPPQQIRSERVARLEL